MQKDPNKVKALEAAIAQIEKNYGQGSIMKLGDTRHMQVESGPTGALSLYVALGVGGIPKGRIVEIYGPEASGKTTVALHMVAEVQKQGGIAGFIDADHALDPVSYTHLAAKNFQGRNYGWRAGRSRETGRSKRTGSAGGNSEDACLLGCRIVS